MFGEVIGVWLCTVLNKYAKLKHINLVEIGPGRGAMMGDILRTFGQLQILKNMNVNLIESSPNLRRV